MAYTPNDPQDGELIDAPDFRNQFHGIVDLIQTGTVGPPGQDGKSVTNAVVDAVTTLNPGDAVQVAVSYDVPNATVHLSFGIPKGTDGTNGSNGNDGSVGPPFTNFVIDSVTMLNPGDPPSATATFSISR